MQGYIRTTRTVRADHSIEVSDHALAPGSIVVVTIETASSTSRRVPSYPMAGAMNLDAWDPFAPAAAIEDWDALRDSA